MPNPEDRHRETLREIHNGTSPRAARANRFANLALAMMGDFVPSDRRCRELIYEQFVIRGYEHNLEIVSVPPEWDALDKLAIEKAMLATKIAKFEIDSAITAGVGHGASVPKAP